MHISCSQANINKIKTYGKNHESKIQDVITAGLNEFPLPTGKKKKRERKKKAPLEKLLNNLFEQKKKNINYNSHDVANSICFWITFLFVMHNKGNDEISFV